MPSTRVNFDMVVNIMKCTERAGLIQARLTIGYIPENVTDVVGIYASLKMCQSDIFQ